MEIKLKGKTTKYNSHKNKSKPCKVIRLIYRQDFIQKTFDPQNGVN